MITEISAILFLRPPVKSATGPNAATLHGVIPFDFET